MLGAVVLMALSAVRPAQATTIGPDAFGYTARDVGIAFVDISGTGTQVLANDDDSVVSAAIGFGFNFYGNSIATAFIRATAGSRSTPVMPPSRTGISRRNRNWRHPAYRGCGTQWSDNPRSGHQLGRRNRHVMAVKIGRPRETPGTVTSSRSSEYGNNR